MAPVLHQIWRLTWFFFKSANLNAVTTYGDLLKSNSKILSRKDFAEKFHFSSTYTLK